MLTLSIIALFIGPVLYQWLRTGGRLVRTVEQGLVAALVILVVFLLVPESFRALGPWSLLLMALGYGVPSLLEFAIRRAAGTFHMISLFLALGGLTLHAMLDGAGLAGGGIEGHGHNTLGLAIVLHRFGMGLVLWLMVQPVFGRRAAIAVLMLVAGATVVGYYGAGALEIVDQSELFHVVQALIIGMIIHSLVHRDHTHRSAHED